jgi:hypothetical protein
MCSFIDRLTMANFPPCKRRKFFICAFLLHTVCVDSLLQQRLAFGKRRIALASSSGNENVDDVRRLLESSWNAETMGQVPTSAELAAKAAGSSLLIAMERESTSIFLVNMLLPQYDISQGDLLYDEVLAVQFCIELANRMEGKSSIVVRDDRTVETVSRIIDARERDQRQPSEKTHEEEDDDDSNELENDDVADFGSIGDAGGGDSSDSSDGVDSFRQQLMSTWEAPAAEKASPRATNNEPQVPTKEAQVLTRGYRLASMLGDATKLPSGAEMMDAVMKAVAANAQPEADEDTLIILSPTSKEETIGVRALAAKFEGKKTIIMVNSKLDPLPHELSKAVTVYSILPLIARAVVSEQNIFGSEPKQDPKPPKIVVLRRYPRDWEIHIDSGNAFELAASVPAEQVGRNGPSIQWIAERVKQHMQSKLG